MYSGNSFDVPVIAKLHSFLLFLHLGFGYPSVYMTSARISINRVTLKP